MTVSHKRRPTEYMDITFGSSFTKIVGGIGRGLEVRKIVKK